MARIPGLGTSDVDIQMSNTFSVVSTHTRMPRADDCRRCAMSLSEHAEGKCLFDSTESISIDKDEFVSRFQSWVVGKRVEDALAAIVYELTKSDR